MILVGRRRRPVGADRARGPRRPRRARPAGRPGQGTGLDRRSSTTSTSPASTATYVTVTDLDRDAFCKPTRGASAAAAPASVKESMDAVGRRTLGAIGRVDRLRRRSRGEDDVFVRRRTRRRGSASRAMPPARSWATRSGTSRSRQPTDALFPYDDDLSSTAESTETLMRWLWPFRTDLGNRRDVRRDVRRAAGCRGASGTSCPHERLGRRCRSRLRSWRRTTTSCWTGVGRCSSSRRR